MHILLIHQAFVPINQAGGTRHHELARFLVQHGHKVTIIASPISYLTGRSQNEDPLTSQGENKNIKIIWVNTYSALHRSFVHRVISFFSFMVSSFLAGTKVRDVDLVWGTSPPIFQGVTAWILARLKKEPFLFEVRDLWPAFAVQVGVLKNPLLIYASEWLEGFLYRHADRVIVNSPGYIDFVRERGAKNVALIPNGTDINMFTPQSNGESFRVEHELGDKYVVMYAGAHGMSNDLPVVLKAAELLQDEDKVTFVFIGDGKEKQNLINQAEKMGLKNVCFLPPLPKAQMAPALNAADACLAILKPVPLYAKVYPNKVFDYMACGKPVILAIDGVIREVIETADAGLFVPPGKPKALADAVRYLMNNSKLCKQMGENGREYVEQNFDRSALGEVLVNIVEDMN
jgi:glycosyltransferase involved in cell wall biosynthesis